MVDVSFNSRPRSTVSTNNNARQSKQFSIYLNTFVHSNAPRRGDQLGRDGNETIDQLYLAVPGREEISFNVYFIPWMGRDDDRVIGNEYGDWGQRDIGWILL